MNDSPTFAQASPARDADPSSEALLNSILCRADAHYAREDWVAARDAIGLAVTIAPNKSEILGVLGSLHFRLKDYPEACAAFTTAVRQNPVDPDLYSQLAMVCIELKQIDEARVALQRSLKLRPSNPIARRLLGDLDFEAKNYFAAAQQYCALLESNPNVVSVLLHLGKCLYEVRDLASARWCFDRVNGLEQSNASALEFLKVIAADRGGAAVVNEPSIDFAGVKSEQAIDIRVCLPLQELVAHTLAFCDRRVSGKDFTAASQALCRAVNLAPKSSDILIHRGRLSLFLNDTETAQRDFTEALRIDPNCTNAFSGLACYHLRQAELTEAEAAADHALGFDPANEEAARVKSEVQAERLKVRFSGPNRMGSRSTLAKRVGSNPNSCKDRVLECADGQQTTEAKLSSFAARSQYSEAAKERAGLTSSPTRWPEKAWTSSNLHLPQIPDMLPTSCADTASADPNLLRPREWFHKARQLSDTASPISLSMNHSRLASPQTPIFSFGQIRSENPTTADSSILVPPQEIS